MKTGVQNPDWSKPVIFREWRDHLMLEPFDDATKSRYIRALREFFAHCKKSGKLASIGFAKAYLDAGTVQGKCGPVDREALRWFFHTYKKEAVHLRPRFQQATFKPQPMPISKDAPAWEAKLIRAVRVRGLLWNTEQAYRNWLRRFAKAIGPMTKPAFRGYDIFEMPQGG
ncbi:MAG: hypothetical protein QM715_01315 [Nibricoccus sp.]